MSNSSKPFTTIQNFSTTNKFVFREELLVIFILEKNTSLQINKIISTIKNCIYNYILFVDESYEYLDELASNQIKYFDTNDLELDNIFNKAFKYALDNKYQYTVQFDLDGQYDIREIELFHIKAVEGYDLIVGDRLGNRSFKYEKINSNLSNILKMSSIELKDVMCNYRLFNWNFMELYLLQKIKTIEPYGYKKTIQKNNIKVVKQPVSIRLNNESFRDEKNLKTKAKFFLKMLF